MSMFLKLKAYHLKKTLLPSVTKALADAGLNYTDVEQAVVGYCYGENGKRVTCSFVMSVFLVHI